MPLNRYKSVEEEELRVIRFYRGVRVIIEVLEDVFKALEFLDR